MIEDIKTLLGLNDDSKDELLQLIINLASDDAKSKTGCEDMLILRSVIIDMVVYRYNRLGTEGLESENYSSVSYHYSSDYPESILSALNFIRKSQKGMGSFKILW
jgi:hypothetical protein